MLTIESKITVRDLLQGIEYKMANRENCLRIATRLRRALAPRSVCVLLSILLVSCQPDASEDRQIHDRLLTMDSHVDVPRTFATAEIDPGQDSDAQVNRQQIRS